MSGIKQYGDSPILKLLFEEVEAMMAHALGNGTQISALMVRELEGYRRGFVTLMKEPSNDEEASGAQQSVDRDQLAEGLAAIHNELSKVIKPASPRGVMLLKKEESAKSPLKVFGPVPLIRHVMIASLLFLFAFVGVSLSPEVNARNIEAGLFASEGIPLLLNLLFLLCAAGLGACFSALFKANSYVVSGTYEPRYEATYWARIILGLIAGLLLATLIPVAEEAGDWAQFFGKPLLALLGGFSAALLYRILSRLVDTVESFFVGETKDLIRLNEQDAKNRADEEQMASRVKMAQSLMKLQNKLNNGSASTEVSSEVASIIDEIMQNDMRPVSKTTVSLEQAKSDSDA